MQKKQGISLIVLVITIIVMIILAASVVITLSNTGVIDRARQAVDLTNESQVQDLAAVIWADAYMDGKRGQVLLNQVKQELDEQGVKETEWNIIVTDTGASVVKKQDGLVEWEQAYVYKDGEWSEKITSGTLTGDVIVTFYKTGKKVTPKEVVIINQEEKATFDEGEAYSLVIECSTEIPSLYDETTGEYKAWLAEAFDYLEGKTTTCIIPYVTSATIIGNITRIPEGMFYGASSMTGVTLPDSITEIGGTSFMSCKSLSSIDWPSEIKIIGGYAFCCAGITTLNLPNTLEIIEAEAFSGNSSLISVTISENVKKIGIQAFLDCSNLKTVNILSEVLTTVESNCFSGISSDAVISVANETIKQLLVDNQYSDSDTTIEVRK